MSSYITDSCPCGRTANRLTGIVGRAGDAVKVRGMFVVARQAEQAVTSFEQVSRFQIVVKRREHRDEMVLKVELKDETADKRKQADSLQKKIHDACRIKADKIDFVEKGTIPEQRQTIVDERAWK